MNNKYISLFAACCLIASISLASEGGAGAGKRGGKVAAAAKAWGGGGTTGAVIPPTLPGTVARPVAATVALKAPAPYATTHPSSDDEETGAAPARGGSYADTTAGRKAAAAAAAVAHDPKHKEASDSLADLDKVERPTTPDDASSIHTAAVGGAATKWPRFNAVRHIDPATLVTAAPGYLSFGAPEGYGLTVGAALKAAIDNEEVPAAKKTARMKDPAKTMSDMHSKFNDPAQLTAAQTDTVVGFLHDEALAAKGVRVISRDDCGEIEERTRTLLAFQAATTLAKIAAVEKQRKLEADARAALATAAEKRMELEAEALGDIRSLAKAEANACKVLTLAGEDHPETTFNHVDRYSERSVAMTYRPRGESLTYEQFEAAVKALAAGAAPAGGAGGGAGKLA